MARFQPVTTEVARSSSAMLRAASRFARPGLAGGGGGGRRQRGGRGRRGPRAPRGGRPHPPGGGGGGRGGGAPPPPPPPHDDRYARTSEFLDVLRGVWDGEPYDHDGRFFSTHGAALPPGLAGQP
ncbi:LLM class flavin-dependent oxidoreductase, partial [Nocardia cyriacigeorgica]|uniref:LLM class flavin-dependent oxidoreductase n=1 Tax=Nocardia cyriacigeorgica TaxID=135487 RepID=UPI002458B3A2